MTNCPIKPSQLSRAALPFLAVVALALPFLHPLTAGKLFLSSDTLFHLYRLIGFDHAFRHGGLWPRYVPGLVFGYGLPLFNFYSPVSLYPSEALHLLGLNFIGAYLGGLAFFTLLAALGAYLLGRAWGGPTAGLAAAAAFVYSPFFAYQVYENASPSQTAGLALLPWILWAFWRLAVHGRRRDFVLAAACFAALILTHNIFALYGAGLLTLYALALSWVAPDRWRALPQLALAMVFSVAATAYYWLPALAETRYIFIERGSYGILDFHNNFSPLAETLSLPRLADPTWFRPTFRPLGWPQIALAALAAVMAALSDRRWRVPVIFALPTSAVLLWLTTPASEWVWETAPLLHYTQHPWRMIGPISALLALLAGAGVATISSRIRRPLVQGGWIVTCLLVMMIYTLPGLYVPHIEDPRAETIRDVHAFERSPPYYVGTLTAGEYIPRWTTEYPPSGALRPLYKQGEVIPRLQSNPDITLQAETWRPTSASLSFTAANPATLVFNWLYFPGWQARLDGQPVPVEPHGTKGLLAVQVPAGEHTLVIHFGPTPVRRMATIASLAALAVLAGFLALRLPPWHKTTEPGPAPPWKETFPAIAAAITAGLLVLAGKVLIVDRFDTPIRRERFAAGIEAAVQTPVGATFGQQVTLLGFDLSRSRLPSGGSTRLTAYWSLAGEPVPEDYIALVSLFDPADNLVLETRLGPDDRVPTTYWSPGKYVRDRLRVAVPPGTPPGTYTIRVRLHDPQTGRNFEAFDAAGAPLGMYAPIGSLTVERPPRPARPAELGFEPLLMASLTGDLTLVGVGPLPPGGEVGQPLLLIVGWQAEMRPGVDYHARLLWLDAAGQVAARSPDFPPVSSYPTTQWARGDTWKAVHVLSIPGRLAEGTYDVALQLVDPAGDARGESPVIGQMAVGTPPRTFAAPENLTPVAAATWQNGIKLLGYDLPAHTIPPGETLALTLYWQPGDDLTTNLTVFVHLVDAEGRIVAQQDQIPAAGARPTLGWAPGEVVSDPYTLFVGENIPPGEYRLRIGWYDAQTGERVPLTDDSQFRMLPQVITVR